jgi:hypothetical protein
MSEPIELKPCPHCGGSNVMPELEVRGDMIFVFIACHGCYCRGPEINTCYPPLVVNAAQSWNERTELLHVEDALAMVNKLRTALHNLVEACHRADNNGELAADIDGSLMSAAWEALK